MFACAMSARKAIGIAVMLAGLAAFCWGLFHLIQTGTCASGGPYQIVRECPEGTGTHAAALTLGIIVSLVGGLAGGLWLYLVPIMFTAVGGSSIAAGLIGDPPPGMGTFPFVFGGLFLAFGLLPLIGIVVVKQRWKRPGTASGDAATGRTKTPLFGARGVPSRVSRPVHVPADAGAGSTAGATPPPAVGSADEPEPLRKLAQLERLAELERSGAITSAEYERLKTEILSQ
jgi:hypothetical protein